jgi:flagellar motility protein MotE (MotC chaperone)
MKLRELRERANSGDAGAQAALDTAAKEMVEQTRNLASLGTVPQKLANSLEIDHSATQRAAMKAAKAIGDARQAEVQRQEAMLRELAATREAMEAAEAREAAAEERVRAAESREAAAGERAEERERLLVRLAVVSAVLTALSTIAAIVAIVG